MSENRGPGDLSESDAYTVHTMAVREVRDYTSHIVGKMKTLIDAVIVDPKQNKAMKDLIHTQIWNDSYMPIVNWAQRVLDPNNKEQTREYFPFSHGDNAPLELNRNGTS